MRIHPDVSTCTESRGIHPSRQCLHMNGISSRLVSYPSKDGPRGKNSLCGTPDGGCNGVVFVGRGVYTETRPDEWGVRCTNARVIGLYSSQSRRKIRDAQTVNLAVETRRATVDRATAGPVTCAYALSTGASRPTGGTGGCALWSRDFCCLWIFASATVSAHSGGKRRMDDATHWDRSPCMSPSRRYC